MSLKEELLDTLIEVADITRRYRPPSALFQHAPGLVGQFAALRADLKQRREFNQLAALIQSLSEEQLENLEKFFEAREDLQQKHPLFYPFSKGDEASEKFAAEWDAIAGSVHKMELFPVREPPPMPLGGVGIVEGGPLPGMNVAMVSEMLTAMANLPADQLMQLQGAAEGLRTAARNARRLNETTADVPLDADLSLTT